VPLGTGGCLNRAKGWICRPTFVISADMLFEFDLNKIAQFHHSHSSMATLTVHPNAHPLDSDLVLSNSEGRVQKLLTRPHPKDLTFQNRVNASVTLIEPKVLDFVKDGITQNFEQNIVAQLLQSGLRVFAYSTTEYLRDIGTPERLQSAERDLGQGLPQKKSYRNRQKSVFLEIEPSPFFEQLDSISLKIIRKLNESGFLAIGICFVAESQTAVMNCDTLLAKEGLWIDQLISISSESTDMPHRIAQSLLHFNIAPEQSFIILNREEACNGQELTQGGLQLLPKSTLIEEKWIQFLSILDESGTFQ
jgi:mannose-1-phosphate guanylyltransferase / phosphomannomutase